MPESSESQSPIVGIDLGTTNSLVAVAAHPRAVDPARVILDKGGHPLCPSVVRFNDDGSTLIGREARDEAVRFPRTTVASAKRLMGRSIADVAPDLAFLPYEVVAGPNQTVRIRIPRPEGRSRDVSPQEVSALILAELRARASLDLGMEITRAVVTVPAYFDDAQRQATRDAGRLAGLDVVRILNEPTAAALAYGVGVAPATRTAPQTLAVYDLGGGTFDVSVLRLTPMGEGAADAFQVLSTAGDTHLGGDDFDHLLIQLFTREIGARFGGSLDFPPEARRALRDFAERAKIRLSEAESASVRIDLGAVGVYERTVTRTEYEALIAPLIERTIESCERALRDARPEMGGETVSCVVLVGGATRTPLVRRRIAEFFRLEPYTALDPDQVVALGAAVEASVLSGRSQAAMLLDVVPLSLGVETVGGAVAKLITRNSTVPARASEMFSTSVDAQTSIKIHILQGEREMAEDCRSLGIVHVTGIPPMPAGIPKLRVEFAVDTNGILSITAVEERSGKRAALQVVPNHGLTREEVERIEAESFTHAREDMTRHRVADLVVNAGLDVKWISRTLAKHESRLEPAYAAELRTRLEELTRLVARAREDWRSVNPDDLHAAKDALDRSSQRLHEIAITHSLTTP